MMQDRVKTFSGVQNFRDFGGYETADGKRVRAGKLFRAAHFANVTEEDVEALNALGVSIIVDLRVPEERRRYPSLWPVDASRTLKHDIEIADTFMGFVKGADVSPGNARNYMLETYQGIPYDEGYSSVYRAAFDRLLSEDGGMIVHCMAGKDRTGILCALIQHALGVPDDHKTADYLLTNQANNLEERLDMFAGFMSELHGGPISHDTVRAMAGVHEDYLAHAFETMRVRSGSVDAYLSDTLHVGEAERRELRAKLVE
jgi:protein-tyrosine phosphatase